MVDNINLTTWNAMQYNEKREWVDRQSDEKLLAALEWMRVIIAQTEYYQKLLESTSFSDDIASSKLTVYNGISDIEHHIKTTLDGRKPLERTV